MDFALSTLAQGVTAHIVLSQAWSFNPNTSTGLNWVEIDFILHSPDVNNGIGYILGSSSSSTFSISVDTNNALRFVSGSSNRIVSANGFFVYGQRYFLRCLYNDTGVSATSWTRLVLDGVQVGSDWTGSTQNNSINQVGKYSTTRHSEITLFSLVFGSDNNAATYDDGWDKTTATGIGSDQLSTGGTRNLNITNTTGAPNSWWFGYGGGTSQPVTSINAQQLTEAVTALVSSKQIIASVPAEQTTQPVTASVAVKQSVVSIPAQQITESNLVTIAVTMGVNSVDAEQQTQSVLAAASVRQVVVAGVAEQITQAVTVNIGQGAGSQVVTSITAQQITEAVTASASVKQSVTAIPSEQLTEAATVAVRMVQVVTSIPAEQITQCVIVEVTQPGDSGTSQPVTAIQCEQITQAVIAYISNHQVVIAPPSQQLTEAVTAGEPLPPTFVAFNIKVTVLPSPFTIKDVTPIFKAYQ